MKIAICFSGQIRSGQRALNSYLNKFINQDLDIDTFAHTWSHDTRTLMVGEEPSLETNDPYVIRRVNQDEISNISKNLDFKSIVVEDFQKYWKDHSTLIVHPSIVAQTHSWKKSLELMLDYSQKNSVKYDIIIKLRFDLIYNGHYTLSQILEDIASEDLNSIFVSDKLINGNPNDIIYIATPDVMIKVAESYDKLLKENTYNNQLMKKILQDLNLKGIDLTEILKKKNNDEACYFTILRNECPFNPDTEYKKCRDFWTLFYQNQGTEILVYFPEKKEPIKITCQNRSKNLTNQDLNNCIKIVKEMYNFAPKHLLT